MSKLVHGNGYRSFKVLLQYLSSEWNEWPRRQLATNRLHRKLYLVETKVHEANDGPIKLVQDAGSSNGHSYFTDRQDFTI